MAKCWPQYVEGIRSLLYKILLHASMNFFGFVTLSNKLNASLWII